MLVSAAVASNENVCNLTEQLGSEFDFQEVPWDCDFAALDPLFFPCWKDEGVKHHTLARERLAHLL